MSHLVADQNGHQREREGQARADEMGEAPSPRCVHGSGDERRHQGREKQPQGKRPRRPAGGGLGHEQDHRLGRRVPERRQLLGGEEERAALLAPRWRSEWPTPCDTKRCQPRRTEEAEGSGDLLQLLDRPRTRRRRAYQQIAICVCLSAVIDHRGHIRTSY